MMAGRLCAIASALLALCLPAAADEHIVLKPLDGTGSAPEKMLLFIPGGNVPNDHYVATAAAIQAAAGPSIKLWVTIPAVFNRLCIISCSAKSICAPLHGSVEEALDQAKGQGWTRGKDEEDIWLAGHSLGGVCANTLFQAYQTPTSMPYAGIIVMGSYVDESGNYDLTHFPKPVLTLNTELDGGLARPGKTALWYRQFLELNRSVSYPEALLNKPVIILPKMNHSNFCPGFDVPGDLYAEVDQATATATIGQVVSAFLKLHITGATEEQSVALLSQSSAWTNQLLTPYLGAQDMERTTSETTLSFEGSSPFCAKAQRKLANLNDQLDARLDVEDGFHVSTANLMHCHPNFTVMEGSKLLVRSCSHTDYYPDISNTGSLTAAKQVACKMLSSDRIAQQLNATTPQRITCKEVNQYSFELAKSLALPTTLQRFEKQGRGICFLDDMPTPANVGPLWVYTEEIKLTETAECLQVASPSLLTAVDSSIYPGNHYCKLLSPARVLDWMMTDGLKPGKKDKEEIVSNILV